MDPGDQYHQSTDSCAARLFVLMLPTEGYRATLASGLSSPNPTLRRGSAMRLMLATAASLLATPLSAQPTPAPRADTTQIRAAALAFSLPEKVQSGPSVRIVADTAWVFLYNPDSLIHIHGPTTMGTAVRLRAVRVERRARKWIAVQLDSKVIP
jgi:hypothetical protein